MTWSSPETPWPGSLHQWEWSMNPCERNALSRGLKWSRTTSRKHREAWMLRCSQTFCHRNTMAVQAKRSGKRKRKKNPSDSVNAGMCASILNWTYLLPMWWRSRHFYLHNLPHQWEQPLELKRKIPHNCPDVQTKKVGHILVISHLPASQVLILREGMLASPEPCSLMAMILNWYSIQGYRSVTSAFSKVPSRKAGAEGDTNMMSNCTVLKIVLHLPSL